ncbi:hypothetical protein FS842_003284 [Serendipita sp. 407]|nr:hypothetical protein FS842_003284 [Serendipita sp. 407]
MITLNVQVGRNLCFVWIFICFGSFILFRNRTNLPEEQTVSDRPSQQPISTESLILKTPYQTLSSIPLQWKPGESPRTTIAEPSVPGFTLFHNLYVFNHTFYVVTSTPELVPSSGRIISNGIDSWNKRNGKLPTEKDLAIISPEEADDIFGRSANTLGGVSFLQTDGPELLHHSRWYNFFVEIFALWQWRCYTSPDFDEFLGGQTRELPTRYIFPRVTQAQWKDGRGMNTWIMEAILGPVAIRFQDDWNIRMKQGDVLMLEHAAIGDLTAKRRDLEDALYRKPGFPFPLRIRTGWWESIRDRVLSHTPRSPLMVPSNDQDNGYTVTYISRQSTGRRLRQRDHSRLVDALRSLCDVHGYHLQVLNTDKMTLVEQIMAISRTTVLIGVHGNDLAGQLWVRPTQRSTIIEIFSPGGFIYDYEYCSRALGHKYYGIWMDRFFTTSDLPPVSIPNGFHSHDIPVNAETITSIIYHRLSM